MFSQFKSKGLHIENLLYGYKINKAALLGPPTGVSVVIVTGVSVVIVTGVSVVGVEQFRKVRTASVISILVKSCLALLHQMVNQPMSQTVLSCSTGIRRMMSSLK